MRYQILVKLRKIITKTLIGKKVMIMPYFLRDAYKTGHAYSEYKWYRFRVDYIGEKNGVLFFVLTPTNVDAVTVRLLIDELKGAIGSAGVVKPIYFVNNLDKVFSLTVY